MEPSTVPYAAPESSFSGLVSSLGRRHTTPWKDDRAFPPMVGGCSADFSALVREIDFLMKKGFPLGLAFVAGEMDGALCRQVKKVLAHQADYVSWACAGPLLVAVFREGLFDELCRAWRLIVGDSKNVTAGVAFSHLLNDSDEFLAAARIALQKALSQRNSFLVMTPDEAVKAISREKQSTAMKKDIAEGGGGFTAFFQPQVDIKTGMPVGAEAVARWAPDCIEIPPSQFIPIAEENGLIGEIGRVVFGHSAHALKVLRNADIQIPHMAINVSPSQLMQGDFLRMALDNLRDEGLAPMDIELEVTETVVGSGSDEFLRVLADVAAAGFHIAIDEFGIGTSSLVRLRETSARKIKLDRAFVTRLPSDQGACTLCRMALDLVHGLGKKSLAYGVERPEQAAYLSSLGCALGQGFLWARPMSESDLVAWWTPARMN